MAGKELMHGDGSSDNTGLEDKVGHGCWDWAVIFISTTPQLLNFCPGCTDLVAPSVFPEVWAAFL